MIFSIRVEITPTNDDLQVKVDYIDCIANGELVYRYDVDSIPSKIFNLFRFVQIGTKSIWFQGHYFD